MGIVAGTTPDFEQNTTLCSVKLRGSRPPLFTQLSEPFASFDVSPSTPVLSGYVSQMTPAGGGASKLSRAESTRRKLSRNVVLNGTEPYSVNYMKQSPLPTSASNSQMSRTIGAYGSLSVATPDIITANPDVRCYSDMSLLASYPKGIFKFPSNCMPSAATIESEIDTTQTSLDEMYYRQQRRSSLLANAGQFTSAESIVDGDIVADRQRIHNNAGYDGMATTACGGCASVYYQCVTMLANSGSGGNAAQPPPYKTSVDVSTTAPSTPPPPPKCMRKAVITVDAMTTEILIASDSVCRLFGLRDRSLIGKQLAQVFALENSNAHISMNADLCDGSLANVSSGRLGVPIIFGGDFFFEHATYSLKPVYGKAVDILDANGKRATICVWSYPLTPATKTPANQTIRKTSAMILRSPSVIMGFNNIVRPTNDSLNFCGETTSPTFNTPRQQNTSAIAAASSSTSSGPSKDVNPPIKTAQNSNFSKNKDAQDNNNIYLNFLLLQRQQENQSSKRQQQQQQQQKEQQQGKFVLKVLPEENRSIDYAKRDGGSGEKACDYNSQQQRRQEAPVDSYDLQQGSSCRASTSTIPVPSANSGKKSKQQQQLLNDKMVESRLYQQQQQKPAQNFGSVGGNSAVIMARDDAYDDFEKRAENSIIIKNGFKRTTIRVLPKSSDTAAPTTTAGAVKEPSMIKINGAIDNSEHKKKLLEAATKLQSNGMVVRLGASAVTMNGHVSESYNDESPLNRRWLLLMEPINALHIAVLLGAKGRIFRMDDPLATILGYESTNRLFGTEIGRLIPSLKIGAEWDGIMQYCCGKTTRLNGVPLTAILQCEFDADCNAHSYDLHLRSISSINGMVTITDSGMLYSYNVNFLQELLGHQIPANEMEGKLEIKDLIPDFYIYQAKAAASELENESSGAQFALHFDDDEDDDDGVEEDAALEEDEPDASEEEMIRQHQSYSVVNHSKSTSDHTLVHRVSAPASNLHPKCGTSTAYELQCSSSSGCSDTPSTSNGICTSSSLASKKSSSQNKKHQKLKRLNISSPNNAQEIVPGVYYGLIKHADNSLIPVKIEVSEVSMPSQPRMFNVGIVFDRSNDFGISQKLHGELSDSSLALDSDDSGVAARKNSADTLPVVSQLHKNKHPAYIATIASTSQLPNTATIVSAAADGLIGKGAAKFSIGTGFTTLRECDSDSNIDALYPKNASDLEFSLETRLHDVSLHTLENENNDAVRGEYSKFYDTFQLIGNGAFGSVKLAARKNTGYLAVAKFVCKSKVLPESWVQSPKRGNRMVPIEVHLLENLHHANIVNVLDVFENDKYYQLVMEKLGSGMDLFEFIEFQPQLDEPLTSYIFRQIVSAVDYLHENHIVHRDLKDENVIVDHNFCCKLIDFGSAAYFGDNIVFSTFCGTMEYCSPEVLTGNKYLGPELEMWSLGILLYTLVFFENPFRNPQETVQAEFEIPWDITEGLYQVLNWLLLSDPRRRATVGEIQRHWWVTQRVDPTKYSFQDVIKNYDHAQLMSPKYVSQLSAQNSAGSLSGLTISANGSGTSLMINSNSMSADVCTSGAAAQQHNDSTDDEDTTCNDVKKPSSTTTSTVGTESSAAVSPATSPATLDSSIFILNSIESDPTLVGSAPRDAAIAH